jgi:hypothetical protein
MADPRDLIQTLQSFHAQAKLDDVGSFERLTPTLRDLSNGLRESYQAAFVGPVTTLITKLRSGVTPTKEELALAEAFMVGDAEAYVRVENDFQGWLAELGRLVKVLATLGANLDPPRLLDALGEVEDARRVLGDICNYLEEKDRVARFRNTIAQGLDAGHAKLLAELLRQKLVSADD